MLADYIIDPPDDGQPEIGGAIPRDSLEKNLPQGSQGGNTTNIPLDKGLGFSVPDSAKHSGFTNPNFADTLAPGMPGGQFHPAATSVAPPGVKHGVLGIPPLFLLAGLLAVHVFVVTVVGK